MHIFGDWSKNVADLRDNFTQARPFPHVVIPDFFSEAVLKTIVPSFPSPLDASLAWNHYDNPLEQKYSLNDFSHLPQFQDLLHSLQSDETIKLFREVTGIDNLEADPLLHGAGLHAYPKRGKLDMHLDYCIHPISGKERRCNLIVYLNPQWKPEYGGNLELWNEDLTEKKSIITPFMNTAVLFRTNDISYHGLPQAIECPEGSFRKSLAIYYVSPPTAGALPRYKAEFHPTPEQEQTMSNSKLKELYNIRVQRRILPSDLEDWPTWRSEGGKFW